MNSNLISTTTSQPEAASAGLRCDLSALLHSVTRGYRELYADKSIDLSLKTDIQANCSSFPSLLSFHCLINAVLETGLKCQIKGEVELTVLTRQHIHTINLLISVKYTDVEATQMQALISGVDKLRSMVDELNGELDVSTPRENDLVADITLPVVSDTHCPLAETVYNNGVAAGLKVLIVDDNSINRAVIQTVLNTIGIDADESSNGLDAIESARCHKYDVIFMDCILPGLPGVDVVQQLIIQNIIPADCVVAAITAVPGDDIKHACQRAGMQHFIAKPVLPSDIVDVVNDAVRLKQYAIQA